MFVSAQLLNTKDTEADFRELERFNHNLIWLKEEKDFRKLDLCLEIIWFVLTIVSMVLHHFWQNSHFAS